MGNAASADRRTRAGTRRHVVALAAVAAVASGCVDRMTLRTVLPSMLRDADLDKACRAATALEPPLAAIRIGGKRALRANSLALVTAGMCAEQVAWELELQALQAGFESRSAPFRAAAFQDAWNAEKRAHLVAARRYLGAWDLMVERYGDPDLGVCPKLGRDDELPYALGLAAGVLATFHQVSAGAFAGVPDTISPAVVKGAACIDSARWWGLGDALQGALWVSIPGTAPDGVDPWALLEKAVAAGDQAGVHLARTFQLLASAPRDDGPDACELIAGFAVANDTPGASAWRLLNEYAASAVQQEVDRRWLKARGHRAPVAELRCPEADVFVPLREAVPESVPDGAAPAVAPPG